MATSGRGATPASLRRGAGQAGIVRSRVVRPGKPHRADARPEVVRRAARPEVVRRTAARMAHGHRAPGRPASGILVASPLTDGPGAGRPVHVHMALRHRTSRTVDPGAMIGRAAGTGINLRTETRRRRVTGPHTTARPTIVREGSDHPVTRRARRAMHRDRRAIARPTIARPGLGRVAGRRDRDRLNRASTAGRPATDLGRRPTDPDPLPTDRGRRHMGRGRQRMDLGRRKDTGRPEPSRAPRTHLVRSANRPRGCSAKTRS